MFVPEPLDNLIRLFKRLPGVGQRSAERFAYDVLTWTPEEQARFGTAFCQISSTIQACQTCGCLLCKDACPFCETRNRDHSLLCVVASVRDVFSIEETASYKGLYHVLGSLLSPLDNKAPKELIMSSLRKRAQNGELKEVILALDSTLEGDATALYVREALKDTSVRVSGLATGMPMGCSIDAMDQGTLGLALGARRSLLTQ